MTNEEFREMLIEELKKLNANDDEIKEWTREGSPFIEICIKNNCSPSLAAWALVQ